MEMKMERKRKEKRKLENHSGRGFKRDSIGVSKVQHWY